MIFSFALCFCISCFLFAGIYDGAGSWFHGGTLTRTCWMVNMPKCLDIRLATGFWRIARGRAGRNNHASVPVEQAGGKC
jgi:hypothetical protein